MEENATILACSLPKAELHVHLEGTLEVDTMFNIARRNNIHLPFTQEEAIRARQNIASLADLINVFYSQMVVIKTGEDIYEVALEYMRNAERNNIKYAELHVSIMGLWYEGVPLADICAGLERAQNQGETSYGVKIKWIVSILRHLPRDSCFKFLTELAPYKKIFHAIGMSSEERGNPSRLYKEIFNHAKTLGFTGVEHNCTAHTGETGPPNLMIESLYYLGIKRIDHGLRCVNDPYLLRCIIDNQIPLCMSPGANYYLKCLEEFCDGEWIYPRLYKAGALICINSDDPAFYCGYLNDTFKLLLQKCEDMSEAEKCEMVVTLVKNSFLASFLPSEEKEFWIEEVDRLHKELKSTNSTYLS